MYWGFRLSYFLFLFLSTFFSFFMNNMLSIWLMLELNFLCFVSILSQDFSFYNSNGNLYYFLMQSLGSAIMVLSLLVFLSWEISLFKTFFFTAVMLKLGGVPFQFWYLKLIQKLNWVNIWLLSVWQKMIPLILMKFSSSTIILIFSVLSVLLSSISSIKQKKIKKILGLSSIFSLGWVLSIMHLSEVWVLFMLGYGVALLNLIYALEKNFLSNIISLKDSFLDPSSLILFFFNLLMLSGIPPFMIFFLKIMILFYVFKISALIAGMFLLMSIFMIFIYLMMAFHTLSFLKLSEASSFLFSKKFHVSNMLFLSLNISILIITFL